MRLALRPARLALTAGLVYSALHVATSPAQVIDLTALAGTGNNTVAECAIACDPARGRVIVGGHSDDNPHDFSLNVFHSGDNGLHWELTRLGHSYDGTFGSRGDPSVAIDDRGTVYVAYACISMGTPIAIICARSVDGGGTFQPPIYAVPTAAGLVADKPYLTLGRDAAGGLLVMVAFTRNSREAGPPGVYLTISRDRGGSFGRPVLIDSSFTASYGVAATGPGGEIYVTWVSPAAGQYDIRLSRSLDGGVSFEPSIVLAATAMGLTYLIPAAPHRGIGPVPSLAVDPSAAHPGRVYVSYVTADRVDRYDTDIWCRWADPAARLDQFRWSEAVPVHRRDTGSNFHPWLTIDPQTGNLAVISHTTRGDPDRHKVETWLSMSVDGGERWAEHRISETASDATGQYGFSPPDYLEYIGVALSNGVAHCVWAGASGYPNMLHYLYRAVPAADVVAGRRLAVPGDFGTPAAALAAAVAGDHVVLDGRYSPFTGPLDLVPHVTIESAPGARATLDAPPGLPAVRLAGRPFSAALANLRVVANGPAGISLAAAPIDSTPADGAVPALVLSTVDLAGVTIEGGTASVPSGGPAGLQSDEVPVRIDQCRFAALETALVLNLTRPPAAEATRVSRSLFLAAPRTLSTIAIALTGTSSRAGPFVEGNTIKDFGTGIRLVAGIDSRIESGGAPRAGAAPGDDGLFRPVVTRNLVTHFLGQAIDIAGTPDIAQPVIACNDFWSPDRTTSAWLFDSWPAGGDNLSVDPRFCDPASGDLSLRIDSPIAAGNSPCGLIGALAAVCVPDSLERDTRLAPGTRLALDGPIVVPPGRTLVIEAGSRLTAVWPATDPRMVNAPALIECSGNLTIRGSEGEPVILEPGRSAAAIVVPRITPNVPPATPNVPPATPNLPPATLNRLDLAGLMVTGGRSALELLAGEGRIARSRFIDQDSVGIRIGPGAGPFLLEGSRIEGARRAGVEITSPAAPARLTGMEIVRCREAIRLAGAGGSGADTVEWRGSLLDQNEIALHIVPAPAALTRRSSSAPIPAAGKSSSICAIEPRLRGNTFSRNGHAIVIEAGAARPDLGRGEAGDNLFTDQTGTAVINRDPACGPVPAFGNRFGPGDRTTAEEPPGSVDWSGWIVEDGFDSAAAAGRGGRIVAMPNPSRDRVHVQVEMNDPAGRVRAELMDVAGRRLRTLYEGRPAGRRFVFDWDGRIDAGRPAASGLYWIVVSDDRGRRAVQKIMRGR